jgi:peptidoglycan hydrolase CwlO-like protein
MSFSNDSKQKLTAIAAVIILLLLATNAVLLYNNYQKSDTIETQEAELVETKKLRGELEKLHYAAQEEIEAMKGENEEINALVDSQQDELSKANKRISALLSGGKKTKRELNEIRSMMADMRTQRDQYLAELTIMREENEQLTAANVQLSEERESLTTQVVEERQMNDELTTARASLMSEKENLSSRNADLNATVVKASVVDIRDLDVSGWKVRSNGKAVKKKFAKNVDRLKVCFTAEPNDVARSGKEDFHVRLISPKGETLASESMGSGVFTTIESQEQMRYTHIKSVEYKNSEDAVSCFLWEPGIEFYKGTYTVEVYNKGYLTGANTFNLK